MANGELQYSKTKGIACIIASAFGFALMGLFVALSDYQGWFGGEISPFQKSFFRNIVAVFVAGGILLKKGGGAPRAPMSQIARMVLLLRCSAGAAGIFANFYALSHIPLADGLMLNKLSPFFTVFFTWLFLGEKMTWKSVFALVCAFIGAMFIVKPSFATTDLYARACGFFGGMCAGGAYACVRQLGLMGVKGGVIVFSFSLFSTLSAVPFMIWHFDRMEPMQVVILLCAGLSATIGQFGITAAYRYAPPREIAVYDYTNVVFAALLGWAVLGQIPDCWSAIGFLIIVAMGIMRLKE